MDQVNPVTVTVTVRPTPTQVYWYIFILIARQFGYGILLFALVIVLFLAGFIIHSLHPQAAAGWYATLEKWTPVFWICLGPVLIVLVGSWVWTIRFSGGLQNTLTLTYRFSIAGITIEPSAGNPPLDWTSFPRAVETKNSFVLFQSGGPKRVIPKRCLHDPSAVRLLREILRLNIPSFKSRKS